MFWNYREQYNKLLDELDKDKRAWRPASLIPTDGTKVYIKCGVDYKGDTLYDVGRYEDYRLTYHYDENLDGEFNTEFGNMEECRGWKLFEEKFV